MPKTRDELFAEAIQSAGADVGSAAGGSANSSVAKRQRKSKAAANKLENEIREEAAAFNDLLEGPKPIAPPAVPKSAPSGSKKASATEDKVKSQCVAIRVAISRYQDLVLAHPDRYGDVAFPELKDKMSVDELKTVLSQIESTIRARAGTFAFKSFLSSLPSKLEEMSIAGMIPLNLIGLPAAIHGDEPPPMPEFSASEEYKFLIDELAIKYDAMFALSPELRLIGMFGSAIASVHNRNMTALQIFAKNQTNDQLASPDV